MSQTRVLVLLAGAAMSIGAGTALAGTQDPTNDTDRAYAAELKADAALRSSLLGTADGDSSVKLGGFGQFRYNMNFRKDPGDGGAFHDSGFTNGFEATRTRLQATGNIGSKDVTFKIEGEWDASGSFSLLDGYGVYNFGNGSSILAGQFQLGLWKDWSLSPKGQLAADFSVVTAVMNPGYTQGIAYQYRADAFGIMISGNDGVRSGNTPYAAAGGGGAPAEADFAVSVRAEFKGGGAWDQFDEFTSWRGNPTMWLVGVSGHYENVGNTAADAQVDQGRFYEAALDGMFKGNGWNAYGAVIMNDTDPAVGNALVNFGVIAQAGVFVSENVEIFGRWDYMKPDKDLVNHTAFNTLCAGANYYVFPKSNAVKLTGDLSWFNTAPVDNSPVDAVANSNNTVGLRPSAEKNQIALRFQFQWMF